MNHRGATTGRYTTEADATARPGEVVREDDSRVRELTAEVERLRALLAAPSTMPDLDKLEALARGVRAPSPSNDLEVWYEDARDLDHLLPSDRPYILAMRPDVVLGLIARVRAAEAKVVES